MPDGPRVVVDVVVISAFPGSIPEEVDLLKSLVFDEAKAEAFVPACAKSESSDQLKLKNDRAQLFNTAFKPCFALELYTLVGSNPEP